MFHGRNTNRSRLQLAKRRSRRLLLGNGLTAEEVATSANVSREDQDQFTASLKMKALKKLTL
jgi:acetyl-CoA acetyltransferase